MPFQFKPQKVQHLSDALALKNPKIFGNYALTEKFNGWDASIIFDGTQFRDALSSSGRVVPAWKWVTPELNKFKVKSVPFVIKAEGYLEDTPFEILNGIFNRSKGDCTCKDVIFKAHTIVPLTQHATAQQRIDMLRELLTFMPTPLIQQVPTLYVGEYNSAIWDKYFHEVTQKGGEGIVGIRLASLYAQGKRNSDVLKKKLECTVDCLAVRLEEGVGERGFASLTLISKRKSGAEIRTVISKHSLQDKFRKDPTSVIGKVVQVSGMYEYEDGKIKEPVFQHVRYDKLPHEYD